MPMNSCPGDHRRLHVARLSLVIAPEGRRTLEALDVAGADAAGLDLDDDVVRTRLRPRRALEAVVERAVTHDGLHVGSAARSKFPGICTMDCAGQTPFPSRAQAYPEPAPSIDSRKATIYDLASLAGVSATTVSSVLSGNWRERRIAEDTAQRVLALADKHRFTVNRQASGLHKSRSGLIGMIIPLHDNRFFSGMAQTFEKLARQRHLYPIVVSTLRDPALELETVRTLISYRVESLVIAGATDPDAISDICRFAASRT